MIYIASDHAAFEFKKLINLDLANQNIVFEDLGTDSVDRVDYTDYAVKMVEKISGTTDRGILICGTGIGMSMMANRYKGIRAAICTNEYMAQMCVSHNNANILCLGSRVLGIDLATNIINTFLNTSFEGGRHKKRIDKMDINN